MPKLEITLSDQQFQKLNEILQNGARLNLNEETFSGYEITLNVAEGNFSWLEVEMYEKLDLGDVSFKITGT